MENAFPCSHTALQVSPGKLLSCELTGGSSAVVQRHSPIGAPQLRPKAELWPDFLQSDVVCYPVRENAIQMCAELHANLVSLRSGE